MLTCHGRIMPGLAELLFLFFFFNMVSSLLVPDCWSDPEISKTAKLPVAQAFFY